jgi:hypothetical protein
MNTPTRWTITVEEDPETGDLILPLPQDLLEIQGWKEGDTLTWNDEGNGAWSLTKEEIKNGKEVSKISKGK